ncbi:hypothetical protein ACS0TY_022197 [Phlomoides rotata]
MRSLGLASWRSFTWYRSDGMCKSRIDRAMINSKWNSYDINGWGGYVLKEKLKKLKGDLKQWNNEVFGTLERGR